MFGIADIRCRKSLTILIPTTREINRTIFPNIIAIFIAIPMFSLLYLLDMVGDIFLSHRVFLSCFSPLPHYLEKVSHRFRYRILSLLSGQLDVQPVVVTSQKNLIWTNCDYFANRLILMHDIVNY